MLCRHRRVPVMSHAGDRDLLPRPSPIDDALPFVGRHGELAALTAQLEATLAGRGSIAVLSGEPGVGKTQTVRHFAAAARARGVAVLWGRCFEGEWSPPFAPWVEALAGYADLSEPTHLRQELGLGAASIA